MTWFKVDDGFWSHPKSITLSDSALALWTRAGSYCCQHLTDGFVNAAVLRLLCGTEGGAQELVESGLWISRKNGWQFHDWGTYQETSQTVKKRRDDARDRQRKARERREENRRESQDSSHVTDDVTHAVSSLPPTRPDPTINTSSSDADEGKSEPDRLDVKRLVDALVDALKTRSVKTPSSLKAWQRSARLLLDNDHRPLDEALAVLAWSQSDPFWSQNVLSMPKFREKYDQLRLKADLPEPEPEADDVIRDCWRQGNVGEIRKRCRYLDIPDIRWPDDPPPDFDADAWRKKFWRTWIEQNKTEIEQALRGAS